MPGSRKKAKKNTVLNGTPSIDELKGKSFTTPEGFTVGHCVGGFEDLFGMDDDLPIVEHQNKIRELSEEHVEDVKEWGEEKEEHFVDVRDVIEEALQDEVPGDVITMYVQLLKMEAYEVFSDLRKYIDVEQLVNMKFKRKHANMIMQIIQNR